MKNWPWVVILFSTLLSPAMSAAKLDRFNPVDSPVNSLVDSPVKLASLPVQNTAFQIVTPVCLDRSEIPQEELHWLYMPTHPSELATIEDYAYLSGQLIRSGAVDASECPLGGLWPTGYANACGLAKTRPMSLYLQNVYDDEILAAGKETGIPPVMIKQLIRHESQFWPAREGLYHFGLGHLTYAGAEMALFWNRALYEATFAQSQSTANMPGQLLSLMDASCPTCSLKIDIPKAERSIYLIAQVLLSYCKQTTQVVYNATRVSPGNVVDYATVWRLSLLNYNAGPNCVYDAVKAKYTYGTELSWFGIAVNLDDPYCIRGVAYADLISEEYYSFSLSP